MNKNRQIDPEHEDIIINDIISDMMKSSYEVNQCDNEGFTQTSRKAPSFRAGISGSQTFRFAIN